MTSDNSNLRPFEPPPAPDGSPYVLFQGDVMTLVARRQTERMRAAGIDAYWENNHNSGVSFSAEFKSEWLCNVFVAQPHLLCAMILWKLSFRGIEGWQKMSPEKRSRVAVKALADAMLLHGGGWDQAFFTPSGLNWLQTQLSLGEEGFQRVLGQARRNFTGIGKRDLRSRPALGIMAERRLFYHGWRCVDNFIIHLAGVGSACAGHRVRRAYAGRFLAA